MNCKMVYKTLIGRLRDLIVVDNGQYFISRGSAGLACSYYVVNNNMISVCDFPELYFFY